MKANLSFGIPSESLALSGVEWVEESQFLKKQV